MNDQLKYERWDNPQKPTDYEAIARAATITSNAATMTEITQEHFDDILGMMPPIYVKGGFVCCEAITDCPLGPVHAMFAKRNGKYFAKHVVLGVPDTYIPDNVYFYYELDDATRERDAKYELENG
jgi:hypothetical protein